MSETADTLSEDQRRLAEELAAQPRRKASAALARARKLISNIEGDIERHGDADKWKKFGDLILASISTARREGDRIVLNDLFDPEMPELVIPGDQNLELSQIAENYFRKYSKARNAARITEERLAQARTAEAAAVDMLFHINKAIDEADIEYLAALTPPPPKPKQISKKKKVENEFRGARRFTSSDGLEILVGKRSSDNDYLTFRIARSLDTWLHAADYPGSHVVVRNPGRSEIPQKSLYEAAQLAAFYSDARELDKAAVNYTLKKFVNKPRRSAPGLVSLSSFKTLLVRPTVPDLVRPS